MENKSVFISHKQHNMENYNGFRMIKDTLSGREIIVVLPDEETKNGKWVLKTEYFDAFPDTQIRLLEQGYHLAYIENQTRWHIPEDTQKKAELAEYMHKTYGVCKKCAIIGMSCGGMHGIYFASTYPELVACMYLDAPVVNLLSCPANIGKAKGGMFEEFKQHRKMDISELIGYRDHPLDRIPKLVEANIPIILICGDSDTAVPYDENGIHIKEAYEKNNCINITIVKENCNHHPHGLEDNSVIVEFINKYYKY